MFFSGFPLDRDGVEPSDVDADVGTEFGGREDAHGRRARSGARSALDRTLFVALLALGLGLGYFALAWLGLAATKGAGRIAGIWLANGFAVAVALRCEPRLFPWLLVGAATGNVAADFAHGDTLGRALGLSLANMVEIAIVVLAMRPALAPADRFDRGATIGRFSIAAIGAAMPFAAIAIVTLAPADAESALALFWQWTSTDTLGMLIMGAMLLSLRPLGTEPLPRSSCGASGSEAAALLVAIIGTTAVLFIYQHQTLVFLLAPLFVLSALRLSLALSCFAILVSTAIAIGATTLGFGPLARIGSPMAQLLALESLVAMMIALVLPVRALIAERKHRVDGYGPPKRRFVGGPVWTVTPSSGEIVSGWSAV